LSGCVGFLVTKLYKKNITKFKEIEHTADMGIMCSGDTLSELFCNAAFGMYQLLMEDVEISNSYREKIQLKENNLPDLMVSWLSELNYLLTMQNYITCAFDKINIKQDLEQCSLKANLLGEKNIALQEYFRTEIKAVTYHQLKIQQKDKTYTAQIFFDI